MSLVTVGSSVGCRVSIKESSVAKLGSVCRRVYRIFSHAFFHHRPLFDEYEASVTGHSSHKHALQDACCVT